MAGDKEWFLLDADIPSLCAESPVPLYYQIYQQLRRRIIAGAIPSGSVIPGEERLANQYGVSRVTTNNALRQLVLEGLLQRERGVGNIVVYEAAKPTRMHLTDGIVESVTTLPGTARVLGAGTQTPPMVVATAMGLSPGHEVFFIASVHSNHDAEFAYSESWLRMAGDVFSEGAFEANGLAALFESAGIVLTHTQQSIAAAMASELAVKHLHLSVSDPVLLLTLRSQNARGETVEFTRHQCHPARFSLTN
ncbi:MAG: GntR family transcriptional regulator [Pseudomonadota bacterium]